MNKSEFILELKNIGIDLTKEQLNQLDIYMKFLKEYNEHTNLTRIINDEDIYLKHFYDSLTIIKFIDIKKIKNVIDVGTGAGFPGMVLKIVYPRLKVTLLDSNNKKIKFLSELKNKLNMDVELINDRAEKYSYVKREKFDLVVSRAVANLRILLELCAPFCKIGGYFISMKGDATIELNESINTHKLLGLDLIEAHQFYLPKEMSLRNIIIYKKTKSTDYKYPRLYDKIMKNPL